MFLSIKWILPKTSFDPTYLLYGQKTDTFLKMSSFVFHRRKNVIPVWNNIRGEYIFICGWTIPFEMSVLNNLNNSILRSNLGDYSPPVERLKGLKTFEPMLPLSGYTWSPVSLTSDAYETEGTTAKLSVRCSRNISQPGGGGGGGVVGDTLWI